MRSCPSLAALDTPLRLVEPSTDFDFEPDDPVTAPAEAPVRPLAMPQAAMVALVAAGIGFAAGRRFSGARARSRRRSR